MSKRVHEAPGGHIPGPGIVVRTAIPGDLGIVSSRHMEFYGREYGFDLSFETYLFEGMTRFLKNRERGLGQAWVAERSGNVLGSIAIDHSDEDTGQLRWFLVEPECRGAGLGMRLMKEAMGFCASRPYRRVFLWTFSDLLAARHIYGKAGFRLAEEVRHVIWGRELTEEMWEIFLHDAQARL
jgi:N-acetylglutamate synthase-like GNAT family acetyltransferase